MVGGGGGGVVLGGGGGGVVGGGGGGGGGEGEMIEPPLGPGGSVGLRLGVGDGVRLGSGLAVPGKVWITVLAGSG